MDALGHLLPVIVITQRILRVMQSLPKIIMKLNSHECEVLALRSISALMSKCCPYSALFVKKSR